MADNMPSSLSSVFNPEEWLRFNARHPQFPNAVLRLQAMLTSAFAREFVPRDDKPRDQQIVVFFLGNQAAEMAALGFARRSAMNP